MCWVVCTQSTSACFPVINHMKICARKIKLPKSFSILVITESTLLEMPPEFNNPQKLITDSAFLFHSSSPCRSHCSQTGKDGNWWKKVKPIKCWSRAPEMCQQALWPLQLAPLQLTPRSWGRSQVTFFFTFSPLQTQTFKAVARQSKIKTLSIHRHSKY